MSQASELLNLFRMNGNRLTLGQILNTTLAAEYRARMTDLRHKGFQIDFIRGKKPSENLYILGGCGKLADGSHGQGHDHHSSLSGSVAIQPKSLGNETQPPIYFDRKKKDQQIFPLGV